MTWSITCPACAATLRGNPHILPSACPMCGYASAGWHPSCAVYDEAPPIKVDAPAMPITPEAAYAAGVRAACSAIAIAKYDAEKFGQPWTLADAKIPGWES